MSGPHHAAAHRRRHGIAQQCLGLGLLLLLVLAWDAWGADLALSAWLGGNRGFPLRDPGSWATQAHEAGRVLSGVLLGALLIDAVWPTPPWRRSRASSGPPLASRRWTAAFTLLALLAVPALKRLSATSCPWDLAEFGGVTPWVSHWAWQVVDGGPGHCFPSGHAVAALAFYVPALAWHRHDPGARRLAVFGVTVAGLLFGAVQMMRGAHYLSHVLWSAWLCLAIATVALAAMTAIGVDRPLVAGLAGSPGSSGSPGSLSPQRSIS